MSLGISLLATIPCRSKPSHRSEMVTELLFGETYKILDREKDWVLIKTHFDNYEGWIAENQVEVLEREQPFEADKSHILTRTFAKIENSRTGIVYTILKGSTLPGFDGDHFTINNDLYTVSEYKPVPKLADNVENILNSALSYLNAPYLWGGRSPFGLDCSGFTQVVHKVNGVVLPRDSSQQAKMGETINLISEAKVGDLAFFSDMEGKKISHVGIIMNDGMIIHASGKVKIGKIDHNGIFDLKEKKYTHQLKKIQRIL